MFKLSGGVALYIVRIPVVRVELVLVVLVVAAAVVVVVVVVPPRIAVF